MKFGIHSLLFNETFVEKDLPVLEKCKNMGFDAVEIIPFDPDNFPAAKTRKLAEELDLTIQMGYGIPEEYNTISPDASVRKRGVEFAKMLVDLANEAGAEVFGGAIYCGWGYRTGKMRTEDEWKWGVESTRAVAEYAASQSDLVIGIEPLNRFESHFINIAADAVEFIKATEMNNVKVHLDTFHMVREENSIGGAVHDTGSYLGYVHACENQRGIPGTGLIPWPEFFAALKDINYDGCITIESFDPNMESIAKLCCIWRELAESPEALASEGLKYLKSVYNEIF